MTQKADLRPAHPAPDDYYVERNLKVPEFQSWASGARPLRPLGDDEEQDTIQTRLRSIVGPPGVGKSTFLRQLAAACGRNNLPVLWLDAARASLDEPALTHWLRQQLAEMARAGQLVLDREEGGATATDDLSFRDLLPRTAAALVAQAPVLLVDGFDELPERRRRWLEVNVLLPFLFPGSDSPMTRAIIGRRDEAALDEAILRWEDEVSELEGLDHQPGQPALQVRRRLATVEGRSTAVARALLEWPDAPEEALVLATGMDETQRAARKALGDSLRPLLTSNPYVNLLLLQAALRHGDAALDTADLRTSLDAYVRRAGLLPDDSSVMIQIISRLEQPERFTLGDYRAARLLPPDDSPPAPDSRGVYSELEQFMAAGIVSHIPGTGRYRFDPTVVQLAQRLQRAAAPPEASP